MSGSRGEFPAGQRHAGAEPARAAKNRWGDNGGAKEEDLHEGASGSVETDHGLGPDLCPRHNSSDAPDPVSCLPRSARRPSGSATGVWLVKARSQKPTWSRPL